MRHAHSCLSVAGSQVIQKYSQELLNNPITNGTRFPATTAIDGGSTTPLSMTDCSDDDPAHPGELDSSQQWCYEDETQEFQNTESGVRLCMDATKTPPAVLVDCDSTNANLSWVYIAEESHIKSIDKFPCIASSAFPGELCYR